MRINYRILLLILVGICIYMGVVAGFISSDIHKEIAQLFQPQSKSSSSIEAEQNLLSESPLRIVYAKYLRNERKYSIRTCDLKGKEIREFTKVDASLVIGVKGKVSPDGRWLAFTTYYIFIPNEQALEESFPLLLADLYTGEVDTLLEAEKARFVKDFAWFGKGELLYVISNSLYSINVYTKKSELIIPSEKFDNSAPLKILGGKMEEQKIYLAEGNVWSRIWEYNLFSKELRKLIRSFACDPVLSPTGKEILYRDCDSANIIRMLSIETGEITELVHLKEGVVGFPLLWSPDSSKIFYEGDNKFWILDVATRKVSFIRGRPARTFAISWAPTGKYVILSTAPSGDPYGLALPGRHLRELSLLEIKTGKIFHIYYELAYDVLFLGWSWEKK